ncbi:Snf2 family helicase [Lasiodiplodia theobromae]|uniref:Snf2 family helicase n=1 Tax=Lasiodiplodia theobromae TaxID=45133 RepID=UPI0015C36E62|nr:Snf2 family helicase [Lasiodiplodia theobromae]KAF4537976.1 Snf2 family helicase [Lasiodiplodia theobromae]
MKVDGDGYAKAVANRGWTALAPGSRTGDVVEPPNDGFETTDETEDEDRDGEQGQHGRDEPRKVEFSDDEDAEAAYNAFKNRKAVKRKRAAAISRKAKAVASGNASSMVGRRVRPRMPGGDGDKPGLKKKRTLEDTTDEEDELMDEVLPDYIKERKSKFEDARERMGEAGLLIPPDFDGVYFSDDERLEHLLEKPSFPGRKPLRKYEDIIIPTTAGVIPASHAQWLRDYQVKGVEFLHEKFVYQRGGILGDDMGLGKTIQVITFLTAAFGKTGDERDQKRMRKMRQNDRDYPRALIICPGTLLENWKSELDDWGWWHIYTYHGSPADKDAALRAARKGRAEIVLTTYTTYRNNRSEVNTVDWDCVIADECHIIKSRTSEITKAMNEINALCRIGLTGTAIQNNYYELWTLLNWTNPGRFGGVVTWKLCISDPLKMGQAHDATYQQLAKARKTAKSLVNNLLPQFFLRRMKSLIAHELPKKSDRVVFCPLTESQAEAYENYVNSDLVEYIRRSTDPCDCGSGGKRGWCCYTEIPGHGKWQNHVFPSMATLQKLTNHLALIIPSSGDAPERQARDLDDLQITMPDQWKDLYRQRDNITNFAKQEFCGKWKILKKLLQFWYSNGDKVLVFSHSVRLLQMLRMLFTSTTTYNVSYLDGTMKYEDRQQTVNDFNADPRQFVFLISTRAGGVGLNITSANKVVVFDPNWNPAYDLQAQDRAYRIGQTRDVEVFRLISAGTIEEIVYARQIYKQQQANIGYNASNERRYFRGVQDQKEKKGEIFGLANLFSYQGGNIVLRDIVNKTNVAESKVGVTVIGMDGHSQEDDDDSLSDGDREDALMSQISDMIKSGNADDLTKDLKSAPKKTDAVQAILAGAGVQYMHENSEVIGTSKVEAHLSKRAAENENDIDYIDKHVFAPSQSQVDRDESDVDSADEVQMIRYKYRPAEDVRMRQFCTMAKMFDFDDVTEFALVVEGWTQEQRRNCLDKFYSLRRRQLGAGGDEKGEK